MPFLSRDWRCPGGKWIKSIESESSWENVKFWREKVFATLNAVALKRLYRQSLTDEKLASHEFESLLSSIVWYQPHLYLNINATREVSVTSTITEALLKLDMKSAVCDIRRFGYICKLVKNLLSHRLHTLSGRSQIYLVELLKVIMQQVLGSCNQTFAFRQLLDALKSNLEENTYQHVGSTQLWINHWDALRDMSRQLDNFDITKKISALPIKRSVNPKASSSSSTSSSSRSSSIPKEVCDTDLSLENLPVECLSRILANVHSPGDLESAALASPVLAVIINDEWLWRQMTVQNFTPNQIMSVQFGRPSWRSDKNITSVGNWVKDCNWRRAYVRLLRKYGEQKVHSGSVAVCENCSCLFWMLLGHPCLKEMLPPKFHALSPEEFINLFCG